MGISDDIKPKRRYHPIHSDVHQTVHSAPHSEDHSLTLSKIPDATELEREDTVELLGEQFFNSPKPDNDASNNPQEHQSSKFKTIFWIILFLVAIVIAAWQNAAPSTRKASSNTANNRDNDFYSGEVVTQDMVSNTPQSTTPTTPSTTQETTPTDTTQTIPSDPAANTAPTPATVKVRVLNGNGVTGYGNRIKSQLEAAGFTVPYVGNARKFTYTSTIVYYKTGGETTAESVKAALSDRTVTTELSDSLAGSAYDVTVVVGKN